MIKNKKDHMSKETDNKTIKKLIRLKAFHELCIKEIDQLIEDYIRENEDLENIYLDVWGSAGPDCILVRLAAA